MQAINVCLVGEKPDVLPSRHCRDARVYGHATTAMHDIMRTPPPPLSVVIIRDTLRFIAIALSCPSHPLHTHVVPIPILLVNRQDVHRSAVAPPRLYQVPDTPSWCPLLAVGTRVCAHRPQMVYIPRRILLLLMLLLLLPLTISVLPARPPVYTQCCKPRASKSATK